MRRAEARTYLIVWATLLALLGMSVGSAFIPLGKFNVVINLVIACAKALLVVIFFMHIGRSTPVTRFAAGIGLLWLVLLAGLSMIDFLVRMF